MIRNYTAAAEALDRAIALSPNRWEYELDRGYLNLCWKGELNTLERLRAPTGTTPDDLHTEERFAVKNLLRRYDEAENILRQDPRETFFWIGARGVPKSHLLGGLYFQAGDREKARAAYAAALPVLERAVEKTPNEPNLRLVLAEAYAGIGRTEDAIREGRRASEIMPESKSAWSGAQVLGGFTQIYVMLGDGDHAISILTHLLAVPSDIHKERLRVDPAWDPLRGDPRFQKLLDSPPAQNVETASNSLGKSIAVLPFENLSDEKANA